MTASGAGLRRSHSYPSPPNHAGNLDWSFQLLSNSEQVLFRRLSVFAGGCTLEAAKIVCTEPSSQEDASFLDLLNRLVNKSMVVVILSPDHPKGQETRYRLLEPIRQYLYKKLDQAGEVEALRNLHLGYLIHAADQTMLKPFKICGQVSGGC